MPRHLAVLAVCLALAFVALGCNGDDGADGTPGREGSPAASPPAEATPREGETPSEGTPSAAGTPAIAPADLDQLRGENVTEENCQWDPAAGIAACGARGDYALDPPPSGEDISCSVLISDDKPLALRCRIQVPLTTIYYDIQ